MIARRTCVYAGHIFRGAEMDDARQAAEEDRLRAEIAVLYGAEGVASVHGALAAGSDILFAEVALAEGIPLHVVLPFEPDAFLRTSVAVGNPPDAPARWDARFRAALASAASVSFSTAHSPDWQMDAWFRTAFREAAGAALFRADAEGSECIMAAIADGGASASPGGTASATADWRERGRRLQRLTFTGPRRTAKRAPPGRSPVAPVLFLCPVNGEGADRVSAILPTLGDGREKVELPSADGVPGLALLFGLTGDAIAAARIAVAPSLRVVCDFGLALDEARDPDPAAIAEMTAAAPPGDAPGGVVLATESFALEARFESDTFAGLVESDAFAGGKRLTPLRLFGA